MRGAPWRGWQVVLHGGISGHAHTRLAFTQTHNHINTQTHTQALYIYTPNVSHSEVIQTRTVTDDLSVLLLSLYAKE